MQPLTLAHSTNVAHAAQEYFDTYCFTQNPYFVSLKEGKMSLAMFQYSQQQFFHAVTFFARPMAALIARIDHPHERLTLLHNLVEEHGEFNPNAFHHTTFLKFLHTIGVDPKTTVISQQKPEVKAFNNALSAACSIDPIELGIACMGMIERMFADISAAIGQGVIARGWLTSDQLTHYKLHAEIDHRHANEFFLMIEPVWETQDKQLLIRQGLALGAYIFDRLYRDLYQVALQAF